MELARTYRIETERLIIRCYEPTDASPLHAAILNSLDHLRPWLPWIQQEPKSPETRVELIRRFRGQFDLGLDYVFGIFDATEKELIGGTGLHTRIGKNAREIGYWISKQHIGNGFATEAVSALIKAGFLIEGLSRIEIRCVPENARSRHIPEKLGFRLEGILKNNSGNEHGTTDTMVWSLSRRDYEHSPAHKIRLKAYDLTGRPIPIG